MNFKIKILKKIQFNSPILIEGLPGIGNVGKITLDYLVHSFDAEAFLEIYSNRFPNSVFVNEDNLIDLPRITFYYKKFKGKEFIFLGGDVQPVDEAGSYEFCNEVLKLVKRFKGNKIITMGGIGLPRIPDYPKVYATGNSKEVMKYFDDAKVNKKIFGTVGPIIGVTGLLIGLAKEHKIDAICLLSQTFGHPNYMGVRGAKEILHVLEKKLSLGLNLKRLNKEADELQAISDSLEDAEYIDDAEEEHENNYFG